MEEPPKLLQKDPLPKPHQGDRVLTNVPKHSEQYHKAPDRLDPGMCWVIPGLAYMQLRMDKSLFDLCSWARNLPVPVVSHLAPKQLFVTPWEQYGPWFQSIQGISKADSLFCLSYLESFEFRRDMTERWVLRFEPVPILDPFNGISPVTVLMVLPKRLGGDLFVVERNVPGEPLVVNTQCT